MYRYQAEERFVEEVRKYDNLYNPSSRHYKDCQMANKSWKEISRKTGTDVSDCLKMWKNLRDKYVRQLKKRAAGSGDADDLNLPHYCHLLSWLAPYVKHRKTPPDFDKKPCSSESDRASSTLASLCSRSSSPELPPSPSLAPIASPIPSPIPSPSLAPFASPAPFASRATFAPPTPSDSPAPASPAPPASPARPLLGSPRPQRKRKRFQQQDDLLLQQIAALEEHRRELQQKVVQGSDESSRLGQTVADLFQKVVQGGDECSRFGQTVADLLRRVPEDERPDVMFRVYSLIHERKL